VDDLTNGDLGGTTDTSIAVSITRQDGATQTHTLCTPTHFLECLSTFRDSYTSETGYLQEGGKGRGERNRREEWLFLFI
jgi:hypothetical protein